MYKLGISLIALLVLAITGCAEGSPPTHYYASGSDWAIYLAWTEDATGHLQGQVQIISTDPSDPTKLRSVHAAFTGIRNEQDISFAFQALGDYGSATWTGTLNGNSLSLVIPTNGLPANAILIAGSFSDFQKAARKIQGQVNVAQQRQDQQNAIIAQQQAAAQAAAERQAQLNQQKAAAYNGTSQAAQHIREGYAEVKDALSSLATDVPATPGRNSLSNQYAAAWAQMQGVWAQEQRAARVAPMTCDQKGRVEDIAGQVEDDQGQIEDLDGQTQDFLSEVQQYINAANEGVAAVVQWTPAYYEQARMYSRLSGQLLTAPDPTAALAAFRKRAQGSLNVYSARIENLVGMVKSYDEQAQALDAKSEVFPSSIECSG